MGAGNSIQFNSAHLKSCLPISLLLLSSYHRSSPLPGAENNLFLFCGIHDMFHLVYIVKDSKQTSTLVRFDLSITLYRSVYKMGIKYVLKGWVSSLQEHACLLERQKSIIQNHAVTTSKFVRPSRRISCSLCSYITSSLVVSVLDTCSIVADGDAYSEPISLTDSVPFFTLMCQEEVLVDGLCFGANM